jgi:hypothetical protein
MWVPSVVNQSGSKDTFEATSPRHGYSSLLPPKDRNETDWRRQDGDDVELAILDVDPYHYGSNDEEMLLDDSLFQKEVGTGWFTVWFVLH